METNQLLINYYKKEELKKIKIRQQEGLTKDEIIRLANKEYITIEEIKEALGVDDEEEKTKIIKNENIIDENDIIIEDVEEINTKEDKIEKETNKVIMIENSQLEDYPNQPFRMYDENKKKEMMESIRINGIMQPLIVRPIENGKYQILAGHNRRNCAREIGINKLPCIVKENLTNDEAMIYLVDTNLCTRDKISPMERARAYKIKYDTYKKRKIETSMIEEVRKDNLGIAKATLIKEEKTSNGNIQRYLRLTYLIPKMQEMIDSEKVSIKAGEQISFLPNEEQKILVDIIDTNKMKLSESIAKRIKKQSQNIKKENQYNYLEKEEIIDLIKQKTKVEFEVIMIPFTKGEVELYFNNLKNADEIKNVIIDLLRNR